MEPAPVARVVAERVRRLRQQQELTAQELADRCADAGLHSLTRGTIAKIESGVRQSVTAEEVTILATVLGVTATELLAPDQHSDTWAVPPAHFNQATARRRQLGRALRQARTDARLTQFEVAELLDSAKGKIDRIERTLVAINMTDLNRLIEIYKIPADRATKLRKIVELDLRSPLRRRPLRMPAYTDLGNLEADAAEILCWHSERIPGPLQSEPYILGQRRVTSTDEVVELLRHRRERERVFSVPPPPTYRAILSESSLYRMPGGRSASLVAAQASHLLELTTRYEQLALQVLTFDADMPYVYGDFQLLYFEKADRESFAYVETTAGGRSFKRQNDLDKFREHWDQLHAAALSRHDSVKFLESLVNS